ARCHPVQLVGHRQRPHFYSDPSLFASLTFSPCYANGLDFCSLGEAKINQDMEASGAAPHKKTLATTRKRLRVDLLQKRLMLVSSWIGVT
ncbi:hypothetical protein M3665_23315, partial [Bacillus licheniformis]|nr:hypothetical protein [Bacillus licheniformis]